MNRKKAAILEHLYNRRDEAASLVLPAFLMRGLSWSREVGRKMGITSLCLIFVAVVVYVIAVNAMLLSGQSIQEQQEEVKVLLRETTKLERSIAEHRSPGWLEQVSKERGMVAVSAVRYLTREESLALSR